MRARRGVKDGRCRAGQAADLRPILTAGRYSGSGVVNDESVERIEMIEPIEGAPAGVIAFKAAGNVESSDYENTLKPAIDKAAEQGKIRLVYQLGPEFEGYSPGAAWQDMKLGTGHLNKWERCAVVTDHDLLRHAIAAFGFLMPGEVKVFSADGLGDALSWAAGQ
jgi:SpoIIAA-like